MSENSIHLDLEAFKERFDAYNTAFPARRLKSYYSFDTKLNPYDNLSLLAEEALNPNNTVPYLFIYKPVFIELVSRWVSEKDASKSVSIVDSIARVITLCPEIVGLAEFYVSKQHEYLSVVLQTYKSQEEHVLFKILLAYYRLLFQDKERFLKYIKPDVLYPLLQASFSSDIIKFLTVKVLSTYFDMAEVATERMLNSNIGVQPTLTGDYENGCKVDYKFLELNEAKRFSNFSKLPIVEDDLIKRNVYTIDSQHLSEFVVSICDVLIPKINEKSDLKDVYKGELVPTKKSVTAIRQLAKHIQKSQPVMVVGKAGSGKTFLINELSKYMGCHDSIIRIHLGEQTDAKLLLGTYTSGQKPGTFEWRSGVLTTAVKEGRWVLIEDIDKAPTEVLSVLLTLLEKRELTIPSRGEVVKASNGFQLISTIRSREDDTRGRSKNYAHDIIGMRLWKTVQLEEPNEDDLRMILCHKYPVLSNLVPRFIKTYQSVKEIYSNPQFISLNRGVHPRVISVRDLVKLCNRVNVLFSNNNINKADQLIESAVYDSIFSEAADCFASAISEARALSPLIQSIGESLEVSTSRIALFLSKHVPTFEDQHDCIKIGRAQLSKSKLSIQKKSANSTSFARTNHSLRLMEQIGVSVQMSEPVLLVGETGTGKTTVVQQVAKLMNKSLTVINVSQQTESGDLLGGYKPVNCKTVAIPILETFEGLFAITFSLKKNERFYKILHKCFNKSQWKNVVKLWNEAFKMAKNLLTKEEEHDTVDKKKKKRRLDSHEKQLLLDKWVEFHETVKKFELQSSSIDNSFVFNFIEGSLVKAVRNGDWLLLDEVNLASADTLESISDLLTEASSRSILLSEKGEAESIKAHPDFRIFACMNPATDVGKRDLPPGIRSRFSEIYVHSPDRDITDLLSIIDKYISKYSVSDEWVGNDIAQLYLESKKLAEQNQIVDGSNQKPHFSIRTLTRTLIYVCDIVKIYGLRRSLYEGFCMSFLTLLDGKSEALLKPLIEKYTLGRLKNAKSVVSQTPPSPGPEYIKFKHYWMKKGSCETTDQPHYIITPFVEKNMLNLVRATSGRRFPVLVQGPTSAGKTSMIKYLADITGHKFVRINNHEHTDLQEYLGTYVTDDTGKLSFKEGVLVEALRKGHWIVLDELNLAPTDVLEALNRLLDDNRELFIPETQEVIHPHPDFMLFATQNPPGIYGGRKVLSRAFRNRFLELHFDDIPQDELEIILRERCQIAPSYATKIVEVYRQLSVQRSANRLFEQKNSFATLRDLFRWALREAVGYEQLAANGYMLLAERCRNPEEKIVIKSVLEKVMKVKLHMDSYYESLENRDLMEIESTVVWTKAMRRLAVLVSTCLQNNEPILLVGETGCGKTTVCQLIAQYMKKQLITINAHQNTETGDILGAQRPIRNRSEMQAKLVKSLKEALRIPDDDNDHDLEELLNLYDSSSTGELPEEHKVSIRKQRDALSVLFEWCDGPLIQALKSGDFFLLDEISLADDSVLERLNSVLEPERSLLLAEKGTSDSFITAKDGFQFFATMNPGGDYGKKELSPALRNRFTEIWVPSMEDFEDVALIVLSKLKDKVKPLTEQIVKFSEWFGKHFGGGNATTGLISLRDILAWVEFINSTYSKISNPESALLHGAAMVFIDALGTNNTSYLAENEDRLRSQKLECVQMLSNLAGEDLLKYFIQDFSVEISNGVLRSGLFELNRKKGSVSTPAFNLSAPTTAANLMRVIRAMQVQKPILLEGSPGVGKTSLISALAECTGNKLTRINLSEQTDLVDLFGSDAPGERTGEFVWRDAPFLRAMQKGEWVLLDEMNLASQSVLEGLNACLDHRGEAYIPELDKSFTRHPNFLVFAAQNPQYQGGGRKGLPKSFVNRFSVVYVDTLTADDLLLIAKHLYPNIDPDICTKMIKIMSTLEEDVSNKKLWGSAGAPWEFNLRDTLRWLKLLDSRSICEDIQPFDFLDIIVKQRFRTHSDRQHAHELIESIFGRYEKRDDYYQLGQDFLQVNGEIVKRNSIVQYSSNHHLVPLQSNFSVYESIMRCINYNWPLILVGPTNAGKTEMIRFVSNIVGAKVVEFSMNSDIDSMDILGGYEQVDLTRKVSHIIDKLTRVLRELLIINLGVKNEEHDAIFAALALFDHISTNSVTASNFEIFHSLFKKFIVFVQDNEVLLEISNNIEHLSIAIERENSVKFEWFDGLLVRAVEQGHWLILDNANLCSPSVLDRLNSLLESEGSLIINECSLGDGQPRIVQPHPNFRLFLTVDPKYGELSRAMRNRGIEIYVEDLQTRSTKFDKLVLGYPDSDTTPTDVEENLEAMSLTEKKAATPLSAFVSPKHSFVAPFTKIHDIILLSSDEVSNSVISILPLLTSQRVEDWKNNVFSNKEFEERDTIERLASFFSFMVEVGVVDKLKDLYDCTSGKAMEVFQENNNYIIHQSIIPVLNVYILSTLSGHFKEVNSSESTYLFEVLSLLLKSIEELEFTQKKSTHGKISELSYLEQSAAIQNGRNIKTPPKIPIFGLLSNLKDFVLNALTTESLFSSEKIYKLYFKLYVIWFGAFETSAKRDEAKLRVYQELLEKWIGEAETDIKDCSKITSIAKEFGKSLSLTSGTSMTLIWEEFRKRYPSSAESWEQHDAILSIAAKFDQIADEQFSDSYTMIRDLREIFVGLNDEILNSRSDQFEVITSRLESGIDQLNQISSNFLNKRKHFFKEEFTSILRLLFHDDSEMTEIISEVASNSSISTEKLVKLYSKSYAYPAAFDLLWTKDDGKFVSHLNSVFTSSLFENVLKKSNLFKNFAGSQINQTLDDANLLLCSLVKSSRFVLTDQLEVYKNILLQWYHRILKIHTGTETSELKIQRVLELVNDSNDKFFKQVHEQFLLPAVLILNEFCTPESLGKAWIIFSSGLIQLYVPSSPYDPAVHDYVLYDSFTRQKKLSQELVASWKNCRTVISGDRQITAEKLIEITDDSDAPKKPKVYRPSDPIDSLFDEWSAFMNSTVDLKPVERLLESLGSSSQMSYNQVAMFQQNTSQFLSRLATSFKHYSDLNDIFAGYVFGLKFGFELIANAKQDEARTVTVSPLWAIDTAEITNPDKINHAFNELNKYFKERTVESLNVESVLVFFLKLFKLHRKETNMMATLNDVLQVLYYRWSLRRMNEEQKAQEQGSIFRYNDTSGDIEADFRKLFPDYEDVLSVNEGSSNDKPASVSLEDIYYELAKGYLAIFDNENEHTLSDVVYEGSQVSDILLKNANEFKSHKLNASKLVSVVNKLSQEIDAFRVPINNKDLDFYRGYSIVETKRAVQLIEKLWNSVNNLLKQWPEHATLKDLFRICQEFLSYPANTPIARLLQKVEQVYTFVVEWEKYASVKVSLSAHIKEITDLIVSWRRLELQTWNSLFNYENIHIERNIGKWWFYLFETIIVSNNTTTQKHADEIEQEYTKLLTSLNVFFGKSTYGEFGIRLSLVKAFAEHVKMLHGDKSFVLDALNNIVSFYEQFKPSIDEHIATGRKHLEKEVSEVILLASWKDVNVDALKQSSRRSHNSLYKLVRKYRDILSGEVSNLIENGIPATQKVSSKVEVTTSPHFRMIDLKMAKELVKGISSWDSRSNALKNIDLVNKNMQLYVSKISGQDFPDLYDFAHELSKEANRLRDETPKTFTKENKKQLAALKTQKRKALSDALKELRRIGLKTSFREDIRRVLGTVTSILSNSKSFKDTELESSDEYFFRVLDLLPRLRSAISNPAEDIPVNDSEKGMAIAENLIFSLIATRDPLSKIAKDFKYLDELRTDLEDIALSKEKFQNFSLRNNFALFKTICEWLPKLIDYAIETLYFSARVTKDKVDVSFLENTKTKILNFESIASKYRILNGDTEETLQRFETFVNEFLFTLSSHKESNVYFIYETIIKWINEQSSKSIKIEKNCTSIPLEAVDQAFRKVHISIMVSLQKLMEVQGDPINEEEDKWLVESNRRIMGNVKLLHSGRVTSNISEAVDLIKCSDFNSDDSKLVSAVVSFTMPLINQYLSLLVSVLEKAKRNYQQTSRATYVLCTLLYNLGKDGFCSPEPPSEEKESDNLQEGTGLGDGEGAKNNSNDIEQDDDLTEDAQQANKDKKDKDDGDEDEDDNAVEMEGDMAGELEDASNQEDEQDDEEEEEEEEQELDEEIDDLNEDDPNAIDDKMWDEEAAEDSKEKDSDKMPESSTNDEMQAAEDEKDEAKDEKKDNENDQLQEDDDAKEKNDEIDQENDDDAEDEEDVGEQEDEVRNEENEELEANVPEVETMELPEDMNLDSDEEEHSENEGEEFDDKMDVEEEEEEDFKKNDKHDEENVDIEEDDAAAEEDEDMEAGDNISEEEEETGDQEEHEGKTNTEDDQDMDEEVESEGELAEDNQQDESKKNGEDEAQNNTEGLDGIEDVFDDQEIDADSAAQQQSGSKGEGADVTNQEEQQDIGNSGTAQTQQELQQSQENEINEASREEAKESLKQLGDSLKEFHRRHQEINESSTRDEDESNANKANERPDEFEHVDGENTETDTQALGSANKDQVTSIDENKAIDDDDDDDGDMDVDNEQNQDIEHESNSDTMEVDEEAQSQEGDFNKDDNNGKSKGAFIGERKQLEEKDGLLNSELFQNEHDDLDEIMEQIDAQVKVEELNTTPPRSIEESRELWKKSELETMELASGLSEQLRLILEPTLATKLRGDYKTGKRLNMKRIIPYIASQFRKDKIWLRRTKPSKRQYQIMIAVDDSKSMSESKSVDLAFQSICLVSKALTQLESGGLSIVKFGETTREVHPFDQQFSYETGAKVFQWFDFQETRTDVKKLVAESIRIFERARATNNNDLWQLEIIISDGVCEDHDTIQRLVRRARENKVMLVFVVIDGINSSESIMDMSQVKYVPDNFGNMQLQVEKYLDTFPFEFYVVVHDISELPEMLSVILRQYFSELASM